MFQKAQKKPKKKESFGSFLKSITLILFVLLLLRTLIWEPFFIPSESMLPRLEKGDFISVNKSAYGYSKKSPSLFTLPFMPDGRSYIIGKQPERGDVIVFKNPHVKQGRIMVKRVIGLPGDKVQFRNETVYVNDVAIKKEKIEGQILHKKTKDSSTQDIFERYRETMDNGRSYIVYERRGYKNTAGQLIAQSRTTSDDTVVFHVPQNNYFFIGDNRDRSGDSREWGFIEDTHLLGKATFVNFNFFQSLKGKRLFLKMYADKDYDDYYPKHPLVQ